MARKYNPDDYHKQSFILVRWIERLRVRAILRELDPKKSDTILEVGCGAGNILEYLSIGRAVGLDLSTDLLEIAKTKNYRIKSDLIHAFGESLPFRDESVDKVICSEVLEHVRQPADICAEASRVLKADGWEVCFFGSQRKPHQLVEGGYAQVLPGPCGELRQWLPLPNGYDRRMALAQF